MNTLLFFFLLLELEGVPVRLTLAEIPPDQAIFITSPRDLYIDDRGWFHLLDQSLSKILIWNEMGQFVKAVGEPGQGPGEFGFFDHQHDHKPTLGGLDNRYFVYEDRTRSMSTFDRNWDFGERKSLTSESGSPMWGRKIDIDRNLIRIHRNLEDGQESLLGIYDEEGNLVKMLVQVPNRSFGQESGRMVVHGFNPKPFGRFDELNRQVIAGFNGEANFSLYTPEGELLHQYSFRIKRAPVTPEDQRAFREMNQESFGDALYRFPEQHPVYTDILPLDTSRFLVYRQVLLSSRIEGVVIDRQGKTQEEFKLSIGEGGQLLGSRGRVIAVSLDEEGDYRLEELSFPEIKP